MNHSKLGKTKSDLGKVLITLAAEVFCPEYCLKFSLTFNKNSKFFYFFEIKHVKNVFC